jgi:hypothetical protein
MHQWPRSAGDAGAERTPVTTGGDACR